MFICCVFPDNVFPLLWVGVLCRVVSLRLSLLCFRVSRVGRRGLVCVLEIKRRGRGVCCVPPPSWSVGAAACYSPTSCRMQYHRRARSSLPGSEWVRASPLGHGRRKSVIVIPGILVGCSRGVVWRLGDRMVDACVLKDSWCDARGVSPSSE